VSFIIEKYPPGCILPNVIFDIDDVKFCSLIGLFTKPEFFCKISYGK